MAKILQRLVLDGIGTKLHIIFHAKSGGATALKSSGLASTVGDRLWVPKQSTRISGSEPCAMASFICGTDSPMDTTLATSRNDKHQTCASCASQPWKDLQMPPDLELDLQNSSKFGNITFLGGPWKSMSHSLVKRLSGWPHSQWHCRRWWGNCMALKSPGHQWSSNWAKSLARLPKLSYGPFVVWRRNSADMCRLILDTCCVML